MIPTRVIRTGRVDHIYVVRELSEGVYRYTRTGQAYTIDVEQKSCTCPSLERPCKHWKNALMHHLEVLQGYKPTKWIGDEDGNV